MDPAFVEENFDVPAEAFNAIVEICKQQTEKYGDLISLYAIEIDGSQFNYSDAVTIRIKMDDKMKEFDSFKLVYLDDENDFNVSEVVEKFEIDKENNELVFYLKHLSAYALVGEKTETAEASTSDKTKNPKTGDNIAIYFGMLALGIYGLVVSKVAFKEEL